MQDFDGFRDNTGDGLLPFFIVGMDKMGVLRELCRKFRYGGGERMAFILREIPGREIDFVQEIVDCLPVIGEIFIEKLMRIPINQNIAEIENYGLDGG